MGCISCLVKLWLLREVRKSHFHSTLLHSWSWKGFYQRPPPPVSSSLLSCHRFFRQELKVGVYHSRRDSAAPSFFPQLPAITLLFYHLRRAEIHDIPLWWRWECYRAASHESCGCSVESIRAIKSEGVQLKQRVGDTAVHTAQCTVILRRRWARIVSAPAHLYYLWVIWIRNHQPPDVSALSPIIAAILSALYPPAPRAEGRWFACGRQVLHMGHIIVTLLNNITESEGKEALERLSSPGWAGFSRHLLRERFSSVLLSRWLRIHYSAS